MAIKKWFKSLKKEKNLEKEEQIIEIERTEIMTCEKMLRIIMQRLNIDQKRLAQKLEVDKSQITRWLDGAVPKLVNQNKIKNLYDEVK